MAHAQAQVKSEAAGLCSGTHAKKAEEVNAHPHDNRLQITETPKHDQEQEGDHAMMSVEQECEGMVAPVNFWSKTRPQESHSPP